MDEYSVNAVAGSGCEISYNHTPSFAAQTAFYYVQSAGHFYCNKDYYTQRKGYKSFLLIYTVKGKGFADYRGKHYELDREHVLLIDCYEYQEYYPDKSEIWEIKWIHFNGSGSDGYFNLIYDNYGPVIDLNGDNSIEIYIDNIINMMRNEDNIFEIKASSIIVQMFTDLILAAAKGTGYNDDGKCSDLVENVRKMVQENYSSDISLEDMANAACCSIYHFARQFKKATGYSPHEYLVKYRINRAKAFLKATDSTIDEIAGGVGFKSTSNFIKTFREIEDMTPLKYRRFWAR